MTISDHSRTQMAEPVGARTHETAGLTSNEDACVPTRSDWPQEDFLDWLDATKKRLRLKSDYQLAEHLGIGHTLISGWRNGRQKPSIETLNKIASVVGEDARRLWVLAGAANAIDVGLLANDARPQVQDEPPEVIRRLTDVYQDDRLTEADRTAIRHHIHLLTEGVLADIAARSDVKTLRGRRTG